MPADGTQLLALDPWLAPYAGILRERYAHYQWRKALIEQAGGLMGDISQSHHYFGLNRGEQNGEPGVWYREWAPGAQYLALIGDFNNWDRGANPCARDEWGVWSCFLPDAVYANRLTHESLLKVHVYNPEFGARDRLPAYIRRVVQEAGSPHFLAQYWQPPAPYVWKHAAPPALAALSGGLRIYEAHVGMAQEAERVGTFAEFTRNILPRIAALGYNAVQLMAVMEHPYYGSFGYHVSNFFAVSSRFGTPEELKELVDTAHGLGLRIIMDVVHSHAVQNIDEGLNRFDGTDDQYFYPGERGLHPLWDSLLFDYGKWEVQRFLLSNLRFWIEEYRFDGFRFDGVTSMLYKDHGIGRVFRSYDDYYSDNVDKDALAYLMLANELIHALDPNSVSVAEDVSGLPGLARPVADGGIGFDYRLAMGIPDYWIELIEDKPEEQWQLGDIYHRLLDRRHGEKHIGYVESHDQALVGDKTVAFRLMDKEMYGGMSRFAHSPVVARGMALHKLIRLLTFSLGGEGYLNFMGNEFGHPEWIDFPTPENNNSYQHARRQWSLVETEHLRYSDLNAFDRALQQLDKDYNLLNDTYIEQLMLHEDTRQLAYRRGPLVFVFSLNPTESFFGLRVPMPEHADYKVILNTDDAKFGGNGYVQPDMVYPIQTIPMYGKGQSLQLYLPIRSAQVLAPV